MYDWLTASYDIKDAPVSRFVQNIQVDTDVRNRRTGNIWHNGHLTHTGSGRKMGVNITDGRIKINMCPNKYILGNNVESVPIMDFLRVMDDLGNELGLDMGYFKIEKLDVTHTAISDYPPMAYFPYLCNQTSTQRQQWETSLYYDYNSCPIQKVFYDKAREVHKPKTWGGRQKIPNHLKDENLTRFEVRLKSHRSVQNVMGIKYPAYVGHLFQEEYIGKLHKYWFEEFDKIPKTTEVNWQLQKNMGRRQFKKNHLFCRTPSYGKACNRRTYRNG